MRYISTRGLAAPCSFLDVVMTGLAPDGGLYLPETYPTFPLERLNEVVATHASYVDLAYQVIAPFVAGTIPEADMRRMIAESYADFRHPAVAPLVELQPDLWVLELFHGPTFAFKDFALQLLGRMVSYILKQKKQKVIVIGATSGDTGSAAIEGFKQTENAHIVILHPHNQVSPIQRRQMTTHNSAHVHNLALHGTFDDCQNIVKQLFADQTFLQGEAHLLAVNSINWARIMVQIVYYSYAAAHPAMRGRSLAFSVPTGNFGDIFAGYAAWRMWLPIKKLIVATNSNDILHRFFSSNHYDRSTIKNTLSPSMDIQISNNFERLLFELHDRDSAAVRALMAGFQERGTLSVSEERFARARELFTSACASDAITAETMHQMYLKTGQSIDPHTAVGIYAANICKAQIPSDTAIITLATAHAAKFPDACNQARYPVTLLPPSLAALERLPEHYKTLPATLEEVRQYICNTCVG